MRKDFSIFNRELIALSSCIFRLLRRFTNEKNIAERLGVSISTISRYANGQQLANLRIIEKAVNILDEQCLQKDLNNILSDGLGLADLLCTIAIIALLKHRDKMQSSIELVIGFFDPTIVTASIIARALKLKLKLFYTPPFLPLEANECRLVRLDNFQVQVACTKPDKRGLRRPTTLLVPPLAYIINGRNAQLIEFLKAEYNIAAVLTLFCRGKTSKSKEEICIFKDKGCTGSDRGFKG